MHTSLYDNVAARKSDERNKRVAFKNCTPTLVKVISIMCK